MPAKIRTYLSSAHEAVSDGDRERAAELLFEALEEAKRSFGDLSPVTASVYLELEEFHSTTDPELAQVMRQHVRAFLRFLSTSPPNEHG